jgi:hypothetical protein
MTSSTAATPGNKPRLKEGSRPQRLAAECADAFICDGSQDGQDGRTRNDARRAQRYLVQESRKHPNPFAALWLWSFGWSSADDSLVTANTPCNQPKQASDQPNCEVVGTKKTRNAYVV